MTKIVRHKGKANSIYDLELDEAQVEELISQMPEGEREALRLIMRQARAGKTDLFDLVTDSMWKHKPVSMEQFLEDEFYLGKSTKQLYKPLRNDLIEVFETGNYNEVIMGGALGVGKTTIGCIGMMRNLYYLACLRDCHATLSQSGGKPIALAFINKTQRLAMQTAGPDVKNHLDLSEFFREVVGFVDYGGNGIGIGPLRAINGKVRKKVEYHKICLIFDSVQAPNLLGKDLLRYMLDETNFSTRRKRVTDDPHVVGAEAYDLVESTYNMLNKRVSSRFATSGPMLPFTNWLLSSKTDSNSFLERRIRKSPKRSFIRERANWEVKPKGKLSNKKFQVLVGSELLDHKLLSPGEAEMYTQEFLDKNKAYIISVPMDYLQDFETNINSALRDLAGVSVNDARFFFDRKDAVLKAFSDDVPTIFSKKIWVYGDPYQFLWDTVIESFEVKVRGGFFEKKFRPIINPNASRWMHIDTSVTGDRMGISMVHIYDWVDVAVKDVDDGSEYIERRPKVFADMVLAIQAPKGGQIQLADIRTKIMYPLLKRGYRIRGFSTDSYQSTEMRQQVERKGIKSELISVDTSNDPYDHLKTMIYEGRIILPDHSLLKEELSNLGIDPENGQVDHPKTGSKDVSDAVAGSVWGLCKFLQHEPLDMAAMSRSRAILMGDDSWIRDNPKEARDAKVKASENRSGFVAPFLMG